ncbi:MAG: undecaprenyldiphospho-muramoylpentapeptide beta-N-acetylglucosaminyltransferase [Pseudomonadota bacterium]|nr:undecaprenyldiphospho-muramoylpentapeptide beta-N-acetylglucosaminyltransferase [Pseudomonadota bacterium]
MTEKFISILASGTGGHVYPAYTIANELINKGYKIIWIGTKSGIENAVIKNEAIKIKHIDSAGIRGKSFIKKVSGFFLLIKSIFQAYYILKEYKPVLVIGFGGYVSVSGSFISYLLKIPLIIHEQNSIAGTANKINYFFSKIVFETFPNSFSKVEKKIIHTGNPVRDIFTNLEKPEDKYISHNPYLNILTIGGSQGSSFFNECLPFAFSYFNNQNISIKHLSGKGNKDLLEERYKKYKIEAEVIEYSDNMDTLYNWASLIICRAGSTTISEISKVGRAVILVPFPHATDNHQFYNANYLANQSACILLEQTETFVEDFVNTINILLNNQKRMYTLSKNIQEVFPKKSLETILNTSINTINE